VTDNILDGVTFDELGMRETYELQEIEECEEINLYDSFQVRCKNGCGVFYLADADAVHFCEDLAGEVEFRCPSCNEPQRSPYFIAD